MQTPGNKDKHKKTLLHLAARNAPPQVVTRLLCQLSEQQKFNLLKMQDQHKTTPLHQAAHSEDSLMLTELLHQVSEEQIYELLEMEDQCGATPLLCAIRNASAMVTALLHHISEEQLCTFLEIKDLQGETPLHIAAGCEDSTEIMKAFMTRLTTDKWLALLNIKTGNNKTPAQLASGECTRLIEWSRVLAGYYCLPFLPKVLIFCNTIGRQDAIVSTLADDLQWSTMWRKDFKQQDVITELTKATERGPISCLIVVILGVILDQNNSSINDIILHMDKPYLRTVPKVLLVQEYQDSPPGTAAPIVEHQPGTAATIPEHQPGTVATIPEHQPGTVATSPEHQPGTVATIPEHQPGTVAIIPEHQPGTAATIPEHRPGITVSNQPSDFVIISSVSYGLSDSNSFVHLFINLLQRSEKYESVNDIFQKAQRELINKSPSQIAILRSTLRYKLALKTVYDPKPNSQCGLM